MDARKTNALGSQLINPRRLNEVIAIASDILPAQVINEDEYDIGPVTIISCCRRHGKETNEPGNKQANQSGSDIYQ